MGILKTLPKEYQSEYLDEGFKQESIKLTDINVNLEKRTALANLEVLNPYAPAYDGHEVIPHLSDLTAYRALGQLVIGYNCVYANLPKNELGELWQISYSTRNKKAIPLEGKVVLGATCEKWFPRKGLIFQDWKFDIANKSFYGEVRCAIVNQEKKDS